MLTQMTRKSTGFVTPQMLTCCRSVCLSASIDEVSLWMTSNRLLLNPAKTKVLWCSSARRQHQIPVGPVRIGNTSVLPVSAVRDLGIYIDADLTEHPCHYNR